MGHTKRQTIPKSWPITRKGTAYVIQANHSPKKGLPLLVVLRDLLEIARNRKEVKTSIHNGDLLINGKPANDERNCLQLFDKLTLVPSKKTYVLNLSNKGKFIADEIKTSEAGEKIAKIIGKKIIKGKKVQINLSDGGNYLYDGNCRVNDSVLINFKDKKVSKCIPLEKNAKTVVVTGKHSGKRGVITKIDEERHMVSLKMDEGEIKVLIEQIIVIE